MSRTTRSVRQVLKLTKRLEEAGRRLSKKLPLLSVEQIGNVLGANTIAAIIDGTLRVPQDTIAASVRSSLRTKFSNLEVSLDDRRIEVTGRYKKMGVGFDFRFVGTNQTYEPDPPPGVLTLTVDELDVGRGGLPIRRVLSLIVLSVLYLIYGDRLVADQLDDVEGVELDGERVIFRLAELPQVHEAMDRSLLGVKLGDLLELRDIRFVPGAVEVRLSAADALRRAAALVDPMARPGDE